MDMMMSLIYNEKTRRELDALRANLPHALLFTGPKGVGLFAAASGFAGSNLAEVIRPTDSKGVIDDSNGIIHVEEIRALYEHTMGKGKVARFFVIDNADAMNETAQNAFLKLLEEPVPGVHFLLTSHTPDLLLPTVLSRVQRVAIRPLEHTHAATMLADVDDPKLRSQILFLADGLPAEIHRLKTDKKYFEGRSQCMRDAQLLVAGSAYDKIRTVFSYASDRSRALELLEASKIIVKHLVSKSPSAHAIERADTLTKTIEAIRANGNVRLQLLRFVI